MYKRQIPEDVVENAKKTALAREKEKQDLIDAQNQSASAVTENADTQATSADTETQQENAVDNTTDTSTQE